MLTFTVSDVDIHGSGKSVFFGCHSRSIIGVETDKQRIGRICVRRLAKGRIRLVDCTATDSGTAERDGKNGSSGDKGEVETQHS